MSDLRFSLRPYQDEALDRMAAAEARGVRRQLGVAATGLGKTVIFCAWAQRRGGRTLILAHRDELVQQAVHKVKEIWPGVDVGIVKAAQNDVHAQVVVASVQTLSRPKRLAQFLAAEGSLLRDVGPLDLVVVDEAHHSAATSYRSILEGLSAGTEDGPLLLGVTATPDRGDGKGLDDLFDEIVWNYDILWGIRSGFLADLQAKRIVLSHLDMSGVKTRRGDFDAGQSGAALEDAQAPQVIVKSWQEHAKDRQTLVFTPTVSLAEHVADEYRRVGVKAAMLSGETPTEERRQLLRDFAEQRVQVIANCAVLTEGFDEPRTDCVVVARPTKSRALFTQMVGRGTRKHPEKDHLLVLDVVGASNLHSLVTVPSLFGLEQELVERVGERNLTDVVDEYEREQVKLGKMRAEEADLFRRMRAGGITWVKVEDPSGRPRYERDLSHAGFRKPTVVLVRRGSDEETWLCGLWMPDGEKRVLIADVALETAQAVGEDVARKIMGHQVHLINADAAWRKRKPTPRQKDAAVKWRIKNVEAYKTAGDLSDAIDAKIARTRKRAS
jgi:superfamily II DNA or RNA helicase